MCFVSLLPCISVPPLLFRTLAETLLSLSVPLRVATPHSQSRLWYLTRSSGLCAPGPRSRSLVKSARSSLFQPPEFQLGVDSPGVN